MSSIRKHTSIAFRQLTSRLFLAMLLALCGVTLPACSQVPGSGDGNTNTNTNSNGNANANTNTNTNANGNAGGTTDAELVADCTGTFPTQDVDTAATFTVDGTRLIMAGVYMDASTAALYAALDANPQIRTIVIANVGGSDVSMDGNLNAALEIRRRGLSTCVPANGLIASGGTDFFLGGAKRLLMAGAMVGVHSWSSDDGTGNMVEGSQVPMNDPQHQPFLDFYRALGISDDFYWFTLTAAPASGIHYMTAQELTTYGMTTQ